MENNYKKFAKGYANLEITDSFYLAYRDIPKLIKKYVKGKKALDYGCGGGRSTRFLKKLGFEAVGVDVSKEMIQESQKRDNKGNYKKIKSGELPFQENTFDLIFSSIVFLEISTKKEMIKILKEMRRVLKKDGTIIIITGTTEGYTDDWASFLCNFPENKNLKSGDKAKVIIRNTDIELYDYVWFDKDYKEAFEKSNLSVLKEIKPLPEGNEPYTWYAETKKPLWIIYVVKKV